MPEGMIFFDDLSNQTDTNTKWYEKGRINNGEMYLTNFISGGSKSWKNYSVRARVRLISGETDFGTVARLVDYSHFYNCQFWTYKSQLAIQGENLKYGAYGFLAHNTDIGIHLGNSYDVRMDVQDNVITCFLDGVVFATGTDSRYPSGKFGFRVGVENAEVAIDNVEVFELP